MAKRATTSHIAGIQLDRASHVPLHEQIDVAFRRAILDGRLRGGGRIPSSRALAGQLGVSRLTVVSAFERLIAEGYLDSRVGSGTRVACVLPSDRFHGQRGLDRPAASSRLTLSRRGASIARIPLRRAAPVAPARPFRLGAPALDAFPWAEWIRVAAACRRRTTLDGLGYGDAAGYRPLREAIADYLGPARGVRCHVDNVIVVSGAQQAFGLALQLLTDPGDTVWVEEPGYPGSRGAAMAAGVKARPVGVDAEGLMLDLRAMRGPSPRLIFVTPSHQFPLGVTMSLGRRLALLQWARHAGAVILEDDYGSEYRYMGPPLSALQGLDTDERVIYCGTFSKVLFPALRLAYLVVPTHLVDAFRAAKSILDGHPPVLEQATVAEFIAGGHFARHVARMRNLYGERQATLIEAARRHLRGLLEVRPSATGMHLSAGLPPGVDDRAAAACAAAVDVEATALSTFRAQPEGAPGLVLGFAASPSAEIEAAVERLAGSLHGCIGLAGNGHATPAAAAAAPAGLGH